MSVHWNVHTRCHALNLAAAEAPNNNKLFPVSEHYINVNKVPGTRNFAVLKELWQQLISNHSFDFYSPLPVEVVFLKDICSAFGLDDRYIEGWKGRLTSPDCCEFNVYLYPRDERLVLYLVQSYRFLFDSETCTHHIVTFSTFSVNPRFEWLGTMSESHVVRRAAFYPKDIKRCQLALNLVSPWWSKHTRLGHRTRVRVIFKADINYPSEDF